MKRPLNIFPTFIRIVFVISRIAACSFLILLIGSALYANIQETLWRSAIKKPQEELANYLGVSAQDYPDPNDFPVNYFDTTLKSGMDYQEVHRIIKGYRVVYRCGGDTEFYFYFFDDPHAALIIIVFYNDHAGYAYLLSDYPYDRTLGIDDECTRGLLGQP